MAKDVSELFQQRRRRFFRLLTPLAVIVAVCFAAMIYMIEHRFDEAAVTFAAVPFLFCIVAFIALACLVYRCPECKRTPMTFMAAARGEDPNPSQCARCGGHLSRK